MTLLENSFSISNKSPSVDTVVDDVLLKDRLQNVHNWWFQVHYSLLLEFYICNFNMSYQFIRRKNWYCTKYIVTPKVCILLCQWRKFVQKLGNMLKFVSKLKNILKSVPFWAINPTICMHQSPTCGISSRREKPRMWPFLRNCSQFPWEDLVWILWCMTSN